VRPILFSTMTAINRWRWAALAGALLLGPIAGAMAARKPTFTIILCLGVAALFGLAMLGDRAFPWAIILVVAAPWYPFIGDAALAPRVPQKVLVAAIVAAPIVPWLWSLANRTRRTRPNSVMLLYGLLFVGLFGIVYASIGNVKDMINSQVAGFVLAGFTFLCARRFSDARGWLAACFGGFVILSLLGAAAFASAPATRVGSFTGYGITFGALIVGLLPAALVYAAERSRSLVIATGMFGAFMLIVSQSRSSWVATILMILIVMLLLVRVGDTRLLAAISAGTAVAVALIFFTGSLHSIVEKRLGNNVGSSQAVTHRAYSYHFAVSQIAHRPVFGAAQPGYAAKQVGSSTDLAAVDNGYASIGVDMGLVGLAAVLFPLAMALRVLGRCLRAAITPAPELALALGIVGMSIVGLFYDIFYWAQIDLLLFAMGGVLSARLELRPRLPLGWRFRFAS
jgi:O-antigen ligase